MYQACWQTGRHPSNLHSTLIRKLRQGATSYPCHSSCAANSLPGSLGDQSVHECASERFSEHFSSLHAWVASDILPDRFSVMQALFSLRYPVHLSPGGLHPIPNPSINLFSRSNQVSPSSPFLGLSKSRTCPET